ncbi:MAG: UDP-N-acetylmuramate--L-alanine ligase [Bacteroidetes bacterium]|nr:UDP-N-acetylmuramate--L-alanine ligase [Bacteroidota bacterium]MBT6684735.1 UDP-N-acetylmuramate--L-alanine ligase [Bacteroidota bacterium]MBT7143836.1 UDP-N-acetylmuramate--L-alanine ligase [Bacteroidota bacterium]MBT7489983.1 UDP-N-acetylmuramate--L-alanine ligase [Bacteroidota bacterium]
MKKFRKVFCLGIGGIGISSLARYYHAMGYEVAGYDKTKTKLTDTLQAEGINIHFEDDEKNIPETFKNHVDTIIIYTPAIPKNSEELNFFRNEQFKIYKRAEILGLITRDKNSIAVAGTHAKTTVSSMIAHICTKQKIDCTAFLGGISKSNNSNLMIGKDNCYVLEADEFDRSFLQLYPEIAVITSMDPDHLDIYENKLNLQKAFFKFASQVKEGGKLLINFKIKQEFEKHTNAKFYTYSIDNENADFWAKNIRIKNSVYVFDFVSQNIEIKDFELKMPGIINVENAIAALSAVVLFDANTSNLNTSLKDFEGINRRFDYQIKEENLVFIDDYAHHPQELIETITSVKKLFPKKTISGIFQPHLFSRTKDFYKEFAESLSLLDELFLLDIYPAREEAIENVSSKLIFDEVKIENKHLCSKNDIIEIIKKNKFELLLTLGAGDIDKLVEPIKNVLLKK